MGRRRIPGAERVAGELPRRIMATRQPAELLGTDYMTCRNSERNIRINRQFPIPGFSWAFVIIGIMSPGFQSETLLPDVCEKTATTVLPFSPRMGASQQFRPPLNRYYVAIFSYVDNRYCVARFFCSRSVRIFMECH
jgi:hypothetical protein